MHRITTAAAQPLGLLDFADFGHLLCDCFLYPGIESQRRSGTSITGPQKTHHCLVARYFDQFGIAAMAGQRRAHRGKRGIDPLEQAGFEDAMAAEHAIDHLVRRRLTQGLGCAGQLTQRTDQATEGFGIERIKRRCPCLRTITCTFFPVLCQRFQRGFSSRRIP